MHQSWLQEGVAGSGDYAVTPGGASLQWSVAAGVAWVLGDSTSRQGLYPQANDAAVTGTVAAGHATLPRLDQVILQIADSSVTGASNTPTLSTLAGTATAGATLDNRNGATALPASALRLADILVPATTSGVLTTAMIRDRRPWATGAKSWRKRTSGSGTSNVTTYAELFTSDLKQRLEIGTGLVKVIMAIPYTYAAAIYSVSFSPYVDGATTEEFTFSNAAASALGNSPTMVSELSLTAGSHTFGVAYKGNAVQTTTFPGSASLPVMLAIEEVTANTNNGTT